MADVAHEHEPIEEREHTHGAPATERPLRRVEVASRTPVKTVAPGRGLLRALITLLGVAAIVISAFLTWADGTSGVRLSDRAFVSTAFSTTSLFVSTAGFVAIVIGLISLLGLASLNGWPTRLGGALGIAAFVLMLISMGRSDAFALPADIGVGLWLLLAGSLVCVIAGLVPATRIVERRDVTSAT